MIPKSGVCRMVKTYILANNTFRNLSEFKILYSTKRD